VTTQPIAVHKSSRPPTYLGLRGSDWTLAAAALALNGLLNLFQTRRVLLPLSLAACAAASGLAMRAGATAADQGLELRNVRRGVLHGLASAAPIAATAAAGLLLAPTRGLYAAERATAADPARAAYEILLRIPLGTALPEEVLFRGALLGVLSRSHSRVSAIAISSAVFGLWHVAPALRRIETTPALAARSTAQKAAWVAVTVGATSAAGVIFALLRYRSGSVVAPWMAHTAANVTGFAGGWLAARARGDAKRRAARLFDC
jgi:membrane protease YdiL (CAAX protease family)